MVNLCVILVACIYVCIVATKLSCILLILEYVPTVVFIIEAII